MKKIIPLLFLIIISALISCGAQKEFTTPEILGSKVFKSIQTQDIKLLRKHIVNSNDREWMLKNISSGQKEAEDFLNYKIQGWKIHDESVLKNIYDEGVKKGIRWKEATYTKVEYKIIEREIPKADIYMFFNYNASTYSIKLDDCLKSNRGWVLFDDITFDD